MNQICPYCKSEINSDCYACPVCKKSLNIFRLRKDNPYLKIMIGVLFLYLVLGVGTKIILKNYFMKDFNYEAFAEKDAHNIQILSQEIKRSENEVFIIGEIKNNGKRSYSFISLEASLYDNAGKLLDVENGYIDGVIKPNEVRSFKISRCCVKDNIDIGLGEFATYKIRVSNGSIIADKK